MVHCLRWSVGLIEFLPPNFSKNGVMECMLYFTVVQCHGAKQRLERETESVKTLLDRYSASVDIAFTRTIQITPCIAHFLSKKRLS